MHDVQRWQYLNVNHIQNTDDQKFQSSQKLSPIRIGEDDVTQFSHFDAKNPLKTKNFFENIL